MVHEGSSVEIRNVSTSISSCTSMEVEGQVSACAASYVTEIYKTEPCTHAFMIVMNRVCWYMSDFKSYIHKEFNAFGTCDTPFCFC